MTSQIAARDNRFIVAGIRMAYKFSEKFAAKVSFSFLKGTEWFAADYGDYGNLDINRSNPDYDGLNTYGDEFLQFLILMNLRVYLLEY